MASLQSSLTSRYDDVQPMLLAPDGYEDRFPPPREELQGAYRSHQHPRDPNAHPHAGANFQQRPSHPDWPYEQQAQMEQHEHEGQVPVGEGQPRRHQRGGRRHRRPHPGWVTLLRFCVSVACNMSVLLTSMKFLNVKVLALHVGYLSPWYFCVMAGFLSHIQYTEENAAKGKPRYYACAIGSRLVGIRLLGRFQ